MAKRIGSTNVVNWPGKTGKPGTFIKGLVSLLKLGDIKLVVSLFLICSCSKDMVLNALASILLADADTLPTVLLLGLTAIPKPE
jgi:hypothetical protein